MVWINLIKLDGYTIRNQIQNHINGEELHKIAKKYINMTINIRLTIGHKEIRDSIDAVKLSNESKIEIKLRIIGGCHKIKLNAKYHTWKRDY